MQSRAQARVIRMLAVTWTSWLQLSKRHLALALPHSPKRNQRASLPCKQTELQSSHRSSGHVQRQLMQG